MSSCATVRDDRPNSDLGVEDREDSQHDIKAYTVFEPTFELDIPHPTHSSSVGSLGLRETQGQAALARVEPEFLRVPHWGQCFHAATLDPVLPCCNIEPGRASPQPYQG